MYPYDNDDRFGTGNQTPPETTPQTPTPDDTPDVTSDNIPTPLYGDDSGWQMPTDNGFSQPAAPEQPSEPSDEN